MSIKERLTQVDSNLAERRKQQAKLQQEIDSVKAKLRELEQQYSTQEQELAQAGPDMDAVLKEELSEQVRLLEEREKVYHQLKTDGLLTEESISADERTITVYTDNEDFPEIQKALKVPHDLAQLREGRRQQLKLQLNLEVLVSREKVGKQDTITIIAPITTSQYQAFHEKNHEAALADNLLEWLMGNLLANKAPPRQEDYNGYFKAVIPGTVDLKFEGTPNEYEEANIWLEVVELEKGLEKEREASVEAAAVSVPSKDFYTASEASVLLGFSREGGNIRSFIRNGALKAEKRRISGTTGRVPWIIPREEVERYAKVRGIELMKAEVPAEEPVVAGVAVPVTPQSVTPPAPEALPTPTLTKSEYTVSEAMVLTGRSKSRIQDLINSGRLKAELVKGHSPTGRVYQIDRESLEQLLRNEGMHQRRAIQVTVEPGYIGVVEASRRINQALGGCGEEVKYAPSTIDVGLPASKFAKNYLQHKTGFKLKSKKDERGKILVEEADLDRLVDDYIRQKVILPQVKAGKSYPEITAKLPEKYHGSVSAYIATRSRGTYKHRRKKAETLEAKVTAAPPEPIVPTAAGETAETTEERDYYTTAELGTLLGITPRGAAYRAEKGTLPATRHSSKRGGHEWRFPKKETDEYLARQKVSTAKPAPEEAASAELPLEKKVEGAPVAEKVAEPEMRDYYTTAEAAGFIGVTSRAIQNYITQGKITAIRKNLGSPKSAWQIDKSSLDAYLVQIGKKAAGRTSKIEVAAEDKAGGIAVVEEAGEYLLSNGQKVDPSKKYTTGKVAEFLGYAGGSSILYVIATSAERAKKGLPCLLVEEQYPEGDSTRRKRRLITGQNIIDFDQQRSGKRKAEGGVPPAEVPGAPADVPAAPITPVERPPRPPLPEGEIERRYKAIESTLGESYASKIRAITNGSIGYIEQNTFDETYLPLLARVWSKIREMHPTEIPEELSPLCRPSTFGNRERLAKLEAIVNVHYSQFTEKNAEKKRSERAVAEKIELLKVYAGLNEERARALLPDLEPDGGVERIDALEKILIGAAKSTATDATTKILQAKPEILTTKFDFEKYRVQLASTLGRISGEFTGEVPVFYNLLQTPENFTSTEALENVDRVLRKAIFRRDRDARLKETSPDKEYYAKYSPSIVTEVENTGLDLGMVCVILDKGLKPSTRKLYGAKVMGDDDLRRLVSSFYQGRFDGKAFEANLGRLVEQGVIQKKEGTTKCWVYSLATTLPATLPAPLRQVIEPFYPASSNGTSH